MKTLKPNKYGEVKQTPKSKALKGVSKSFLGVTEKNRKITRDYNHQGKLLPKSQREYK